MTDFVNTRLIAQRAKAIYAEWLRESLERDHLYSFEAIEPESGDYFVGKTMGEAIDAAQFAHPDRVTHDPRWRRCRSRNRTRFMIAGIVDEYGPGSRSAVVSDSGGRFLLGTRMLADGSSVFPRRFGPCELLEEIAKAGWGRVQGEAGRASSVRRRQDDPRGPLRDRGRLRARGLRHGPSPGTPRRHRRGIRGLVQCRDQSIEDRHGKRPDGRLRGGQSPILGPLPDTLADRDVDATLERGLSSLGQSHASAPQVGPCPSRRIAPRNAADTARPWRGSHIAFQQVSLPGWRNRNWKRQLNQSSPRDISIRVRQSRAETLPSTRRVRILSPHEPRWRNWQTR